MRFLLLSSVLCFTIAIALPHDAAAAGAAISLRTGLVDSINSITLSHSSSTVFHNIGSQPIALYEIDFSITAFNDEVMIPVAVMRGATTAQDIEFLLESREGDETKTGLAGGFLASDATRSGNMYRIPKGTTADFTLFVAFTDTPDSSREDRVRLHGMTMKAGDLGAELNEHELFDIHSGFAELILTR